MRLLSAIILVLTAAARAESDIDADEQVHFFPSLGHPAEGGRAWAVDVHGWIFEDVPSDASMRMLEDLLDLDEEITDPRERRMLRHRLKPWMVDNERGQDIEVLIGSRSYAVGTSGPNGHFQGQIFVSAANLPATLVKVGQARLLPFRAATRLHDVRNFNGVAYLVPAQGVSIVTDIDDTIRITEVRSRKAMLRNTFLRPFRPVPGMADLYAGWLRRYGVAFHYVSAMPYQLHADLAEFQRIHGFPAGSFHFKPVRLKDRTVFSLLDPGDEFKRARIEPLLRRFPRRTFICVGDSGEKDPEAYGQLARDFPGRIRRIFIRDVTGEPADAPRYAAAFHGLPRDDWRIFTDPAEIDDLAGLFTGPHAPATQPADAPGAIP